MKNLWIKACRVPPPPPPLGLLHYLLFVHQIMHLTTQFLFQYYNRARLLSLHYLQPDKYEKPSLVDEVVRFILFWLVFVFLSVNVLLWLTEKIRPALFWQLKTCWKFLDGLSGYHFFMLHSCHYKIPFDDLLGYFDWLNNCFNSC